MCRIETSIHKCGHASMPIHEFCPRNPSRLLPNEHGACQRGYERTVPLLSSICSRCLKLLEQKGTCPDSDDSEQSVGSVETFQSKLQAQIVSQRSREIDLRRGSDTSEDDDVGKNIMLKEQSKSGCIGAVTLPVGVKGIQVAWQ